MIKSIFYSRFHPEKGSCVLHQIPDGSIIPSTAPCAQAEPLFDFSSISDYVIPRQEFCDRLVTVCCNHYRVIGYPVCINDESKYERNQFIFNFAFVVEEDLLDWNSFASVVRKLGKLLRNLEEQGSFLSKEEADDMLGEIGKGLAEQKKPQRPQSIVESIESFGIDKLSLDVEDVDAVEPDPGPGSKVYALCEMILEDLNNYCECMIPIELGDDSNTINLKLFPTRLPPAPVHAWHVPILTIDLEMYTAPSGMNPHSFSNRCATLSSDLTLTRILPFIDGISSVSYISQLADTDLGLTHKAVQHLVYYDCVVLLDIFQFGAMYAPTPLIAHFFTDEAALAECAHYIRIPRFLDASVGDAASSVPPVDSKTENAAGESVTAAGTGHGHSRHPSGGSIRPPPAASASGSPTQRPHRSSTISTLGSTSLTNLILAPNQPTISAETLILLYSSLRQGVTLRTWVMENQTLLSHIDVRRLITFGVIKGFLYRVHKYAISTSTGALAGTTARYDGYDHLHGSRYRGGDAKHQSVYVPSEDGDGSVGGRELPLSRYLDGLHCFDEICTELGMGERAVLAKMKLGFGDMLLVNR